MIDLQKCIECSSDENLNTTLSVKLDDGSVVEVKICDAHAEDMTIKRAKGLYQEKLEELTKIIEMAKKAGLTVVLPDSNGGIAIAQTQQPTQAAPQPAQKPAPVPSPPDEDLEDADSARQRLGTAKSVAGVAGQFPVEAVRGLDKNQLEEKADLGKEKMKLSLAEGRHGQKVPIPSVIKDDSGTTNITVRQGMTDHDLQKRFKGMSNEEFSHDFATGGYAIDECGFCKGAGFVKQGKQQVGCPRCGGSGVRSTI